MNRKNWIISLCLLLFVSASFGVRGFLRNEQITRRADIKTGKVYLQTAYETYLNERNIPKSNNPYYEIWVYTNTVRVGETEYQSCMAGRFGKRFGDGVLVLTTNRVYVWMVGERPLKILGDNYSPQFFPPAF